MNSFYQNLVGRKCKIDTSCQLVQWRGLVCEIVMVYFTSRNIPVCAVRYLKNGDIARDIDIVDLTEVEGPENLPQTAVFR